MTRKSKYLLSVSVIILYIDDKEFAKRHWSMSPFLSSTYSEESTFNSRAQ